MKVLLVEDSRSVRAYVEAILREAPDIEVLPPAHDGAEGLELAIERRPDVVLMDLELPVIDGIECIRQMMVASPCPIVVLSAHVDDTDRDRAFEAFEAGAVDVLSKPRGLDATSVAAFRLRLLRIVRLMANARVVRRFARTPSVHGESGFPVRTVDVVPAIIAIGGSTGAPLVVFDLLRAARAPLRLPVVIAQHIVPGFEDGFARWLASTGHSVSIAKPGEPIEPGRIKVLPADVPIEVREGRFEGSATVAPLLPSIDGLLVSVAREYERSAVAMILSGMGDDGALGAERIARAGGRAFVQSSDSCVVDSMPRQARSRAPGAIECTPAELRASFVRIAGADSGRAAH